MSTTSAPPDSNEVKSALAPPEVTWLFKKILKSNGINDPVAEIVISDSSMSFENWCGLIEYITVTFEDVQKKPLHLFVKKPLCNKGPRGMLLQEWQIYQREANFLMEYLPLAKDYCRKLGQEEFLNIYPKCFYGDPFTIVLENLVLERGMDLLKKEEQQDFHTAKLALTNLAKHHALSHAVIKDLGGPEVFFQRFPLLKFEAFLKESNLVNLCSNYDNGIDVNIKMLEKCGLQGSARTIEKLQSMKGKQLPEVTESLTPPKGRLCVLNHGDYWNNNMMFTKDHKTGRVTHHVAVDFQGVRYASPCLDIGFYLFTSVKPKVRMEKLRELLGVYLDALMVAGNELGCPIDISVKDFHADFCKHFRYGFWIGLGFTTEAVYYIQKQKLDLYSFSDNSQIMDRFNELLRKWIEEHPEQHKEDAKNIIDYVKLYDELAQGAIL